MVHKDEFVTAMTEVLELMNRVAVFYAKYHILEFHERCHLAHELRERHRENLLAGAQQSAAEGDSRLGEHRL
jgi:hypothetical protein